MSPRRHVQRAGIAAAALLALVVGAGACVDDDRSARPPGSQAQEPTIPPSTTTAEVRLTKEEYIRQGDAICLDVGAKGGAIDQAQDRAVDEPQTQFEEQYEALYRQTAARFLALKAPLADQAAADRLNALLQQSSAKQGELVAAHRSGDDATIERLDGEIEAIDVQFGDAARQYGFLECPKVFAAPQP